MAETAEPESWGRVDDTNTVFVRDEDGERRVGQFPDGTADEAFAYYVRKYQDLAGQVSLLELRFARGTAGPEAAKSVANLKELLTAPAAVGDLADLRRRMQALESKSEGLLEQQRQEREAAKAAALEARTAIVLEAESLASQDLTSVQWKPLTKKFDDLFESWKALQKNGPHLPKQHADELWKRFRKARQTVDAARRQYFSQLDATNKDVRAKKEALIREAQALASKGSEGIRQYRELLERWKQAGHAARKLDDQLWLRFKAAGDALYGAKKQEDAQQDEEFGQNYELKIAILSDGDAILSETDHTRARDALLQLQKRFDAVGKVPRARVREVEDRLKKLEAHVRSLADAHWHASNPEMRARSEGMRSQLEDSIAKLDQELTDARQLGDADLVSRIESELETKRAWLSALAQD